MSRELAVTIENQGNKMEITESMVKDYLCPEATKKEVFMFLKLCEAQNLNPFIHEAYLIKYGKETDMIVGKDTFLKRAESNPAFKGFQAGVITKNQDGEIRFTKGSFYCQEDEKLVGGWAEVSKDNVSAVRVEISLNEYIKKNRDGQVIKNWRTMPATMIRKVALVQALREAFPNALSACYISEELSNKDESIEIPVIPEVVEEKKAVQSFNETEPETPVESKEPVESEIKPITEKGDEDRLPSTVEHDGIQQTQEAVVNNIIYHVKICTTRKQLQELWEKKKETVNKLSSGHGSLIRAAFNERKVLIEENLKEPVNPEFEEPQTHPEISEPKESNSLEEEYKTKNLTALKNILRTKLHEWCDNEEEIRRFMYQHTKKEVLSRLTKPEAIQALVALNDEMNNHEEEVDEHESHIIRHFSEESASVIVKEIERALQEAGLNLNDKENLLYEFTEGFELKELTQKKAYHVYEKIAEKLKEIEEQNMLKKQ